MFSCNTTLEQLSNKYWSTTFGVLIATVSIFALLENGIIMVLLYKYVPLRTTSNKILASVATADFLTGITVGPLYSAQLLDEEFSHICILHTVRRAFSIIIMGSSLCSIVFLTIDRCHHLIKLQNYSMGNRPLYGGMLICWLLPVIAALAGLISEKIHSSIISVVGALVIVIITACYAVVILSLRQHRKKTVVKSNAVFMANEWKAGKTVIIIITCYIIMLLPLFIEKGLFSFKVLRANTLGRSEAHMFTILLFISNSNVNPIIYASRLPAMRKYTLKLFGFKSIVEKSTVERKKHVVNKTRVDTYI